MRAGIWQLLIVLVIVLLIFGPKALPQLGKSLGKTVGNFKKGLEVDDDDDDDEPKAKKVKKADAEADDGEE